MCVVSFCILVTKLYQFTIFNSRLFFGPSCICLLCTWHNWDAFLDSSLVLERFMQPIIYALFSLSENEYLWYHLLFPLALSETRYFHLLQYIGNSGFNNTVRLIVTSFGPLGTICFVVRLLDKNNFISEICITNINTCDHTPNKFWSHLTHILEIMYVFCCSYQIIPSWGWLEMWLLISCVSRCYHCWWHLIIFLEVYKLLCRFFWMFPFIQINWF